MSLQDTSIASIIQIASLKKEHYSSTLLRMQTFTNNRTLDTPDAVWFIEHPSIFTQGQAGKAEHVIDRGDILIIQSDRGGQVTYHGPGQLLMYILIDLKRKKYSVHEVIQHLQHIVILYLKTHQIQAHTKEGAPGVYVNDAKISAIGLRVRRGCTYHGLSLNINMDLSPFQRIHPCGFTNLTVTQTHDLGIKDSVMDCSQALLPYFYQYFGYTQSDYEE